MQYIVPMMREVTGMVDDSPASTTVVRATVGPSAGGRVALAVGGARV